jgi:ATP-binding protein involved in chromosome partitioning
MAALNEEGLRAAFGKVNDPLFDKDVQSLGYVTHVVIDGAKATITLKLPTPAHPHKEAIENELRAAAKAIGADLAIDSIAEVTYRLGGQGGGRLTGVRNIIAVAAGKGGVGKSTVSTNLALALRSFGASVGLLDADIYGPSVPTMLGEPEIPAGTKTGGKITPAVHYGMKVISVGFFVERNGAVVWRGPMIHKLLQQFVEDVEWGELDYLVLDLPPGTGDAQLSLSQLIPVTGSVIVTTPQEVSLIDVVKAVSMFKKVEIPILGIVENMSYYKCPSCGHHDEIFSRGGGKSLAAELGVPLFAELPLHAQVRYGGDSGRPVVIGAPESEHATLFKKLAQQVAGEVAKRNGPTGSTGRRAQGLRIS